MIHQKNQMDIAITELHPLEKMTLILASVVEVISKIQRLTQRCCMRGGLLKFEQ